MNATRLIRIGAALLLLSWTGVARAADDHEMLAAQQELKIAKDHLRDAGMDYEGHRRAAMQYVDQALQEIRLGLEAAKGRRDVPGGAHERKGGRPPTTQSDDD